MKKLTNISAITLMLLPINLIYCLWVWNSFSIKLLGTHVIIFISLLWLTGAIQKAKLEKEIKENPTDKKENKFQRKMREAMEEAEKKKS